MAARDMSAVVLHDYWRSSSSYRVRIALALKGLAYRRIPVDLLRGEQRMACNLNVNPQGLVPTLEIDCLRLTKSLAILDYLEETRPRPSLLPVEPGARAHVRALALAVACEIHPLANIGVLKRIDALAGAEARARWNRDSIRDGLVAVEKMLAHPGFRGEFCHGDDPTIADCTLIPQVYNARRWDVAIDDLPRILAVVGACSKHPAFVAAAPDQFHPERLAGPVASNPVAARASAN